MNRVLKVATKLTNRNILVIYRCTSSGNSNSPCDTPGLSKNVVDVPSDEVGFPRASKEGIYKNPEYFCYNKTSYFEAEVEMKKYRLPQPSAKIKKRKTEKTKPLKD